MNYYTWFVVADVHGCYNELQTALTKQGFDMDNPYHVFVSLGDLCDRGPDNEKCLQFVMNIPAERRILILGNHEDIMQRAIKRGSFTYWDWTNGTKDTVAQLTHIKNPGHKALSLMAHHDLWQSYIAACRDYYETPTKVFVHGWIPDGIDWRHGDWRDARWMNGMEKWSHARRVDNKIVFCGHWHTSWGHCHLHNDGQEFLKKVETFYIDPDTDLVEPHVNFNPFIDAGIVALDGCVLLSGQVNCIRLTHMPAVEE